MVSFGMDSVKAIIAIAKKLHNQELQEKVIEVREQMTALREENLALKEENQNLLNKLKNKENLEYDEERCFYGSSPIIVPPFNRGCEPL